MAGAPMKKGPVDLAIVFGGKGGGKAPPRGMSEPDGDEPMGDEPMPDEGGGEFDVAADEFLDDTMPAEDRKAALKRAIMACMGEDY